MENPKISIWEGLNLWVKALLKHVAQMNNDEDSLDFRENNDTKQPSIVFNYIWLVS